MMHLQSTFNASFQDGYSAVELPYKNGKFSMYLFLPDAGSSVDALIQQLDAATWKSWLEGFHEREKFSVSMPRFQFEYKSSLAEDLKSMGLEVAFDSQEADFSGISPNDLFIADVIHKTYIKVNEEGTEAAAVTAVVMQTTAIITNEIILNRPFLFAITENSSKSILFIGKVMEPVYE